MKKKIEFTEDEAKVLLALLNISLKTEGINIIKNVSYFIDKFETSFKVEEPKSKQNGVKPKAEVTP